MIRPIPIVVLVVLLAPACSSVETHPGAASEADLAVIVPETPRLRAWEGFFGGDGTDRTVFMRVDGRALGMLSDRFEVPPGIRRLQIVVRQSGLPAEGSLLQTAPVDLQLNAERGRTYAVRAATACTGTSCRVRISILDVAARRIVATHDVPPASVRILSDPAVDPDFDD